MKKQDKNPKIKRIELRVTEEFFQTLSSKIQDSGLKKAEYFRYILSQGKVVVKKDYNSLATQVRKVGINLNEVAFVLNIANQKNALNMYDFQELLIELKLILNQLNRIGA
ncbi:plasmid mobilization protein [Aliarcobacter butzleri]|uniref:plasmid mobilization protein n=1 Tax=Aliarcobacter butzleri TaxID=28197 RepID=UPI003AFA5842